MFDCILSYKTQKVSPTRKSTVQEFVKIRKMTENTEHSRSLDVSSCTFGKLRNFRIFNILSGLNKETPENVENYRKMTESGEN